MLSFIGKFPLPPLHALPRLFFSSHSQVIWPPPPHTHTYTLTPTPFSASLSAVSRSGSSGSLSAVGWCWEGGQGREVVGVPLHPLRCCGGASGPPSACPGGAAAPEQPGTNPHLSGFPRRSGHGFQRKGGKGNYPPGSIQAHPNFVPLSRTPRSRHRAPPGPGSPRESHISGLGRGGTAQPRPVRPEDCARRKPSAEVEAAGKLSAGFVHTDQSLSSS